jgi:hypothetical protein
MKCDAALQQLEKTQQNQGFGVAHLPPKRDRETSL